MERLLDRLWPLLPTGQFARGVAVIWLAYLLWLLRINGNRAVTGVPGLFVQLARTVPLIIPTAVGKLVFGGVTGTVVGGLISAGWEGLRGASRFRLIGDLG